MTPSPKPLTGAEKKSSIAVRTLQMLAASGQIDPALPGQAAERYQILDVTAGASGAVGGDA